MRRVHLIVYGRVQGVFFRHNTKKIADKLNLKGWVRNNPDNSVEIVAEGNENAIDNLINWCRKGPIGAKVEKVDIEEEGFKKEFISFSVIY
jgi:acylphosphatase